MRTRHRVRKPVRGKSKLQKALPIILGATSAAGVIATGVLSARAGYKTAPMIKSHKETMEHIRASKDSIDSKEYNKMVFDEYKLICKACVKVYGWAFLTGAVTVAEIIVSNKFLRDYQKKYMGVVSLYTGLSAAFAEYRQRVVDRYGKEAEFEIHTGVKKEEIVDVVTDKNGNEKTKVTKVLTPGEKTGTDFIIFDSSSPYFRKDNPEMTMLYLKHLQNDLSTMLQAKERLFLNEVYNAVESSDYPETAEGQIVGWVYDKDDPNCDCAVDFGIFDANGEYLDTENVKNFMKGKTDFIYLALNHDGIIFERFPQLIANRIRYDARRV